MAKSPKLSVVILNYNTKDLLLQTLSSVSSRYTHEVIVADNGSQDGSLEAVKKKFPHVRVIDNNENIGFAAGNNRALIKAKGEYILLLNSDTKVINSALDILVEYLDTHSRVDMVSPRLELPNGSLDWGCHRGLPTLWNSFTYFSGLEKAFPQIKFFGGYHQTWKSIDEIHEIDVVSGGAMMFRASLLEKIGLLDENFFMYAEDIDYCKRLLDAGGTIVFNPMAKIIHFKGQSGSKNTKKKVRSKTRTYFYETMKLYFKKHYSSTYPKWVLTLTNLGIDLIAKVRG